MIRPKTRRCIVCGKPCVGRVCRECFETKNNKIAGRYKKQIERDIDPSEFAL